MDGAEVTPKTLKEVLSMSGDKANSILKFYELGVVSWNLVILTDLYVKNKEAFLNPDKFGDIWF